MHPANRGLGLFIKIRSVEVGEWNIRSVVRYCCTNEVNSRGCQHVAGMDCSKNRSIAWGGSRLSVKPNSMNTSETAMGGEALQDGGGKPA